LYRQEIVNGVIRCLNMTYTKFVASNPKFEGTVSIFAHSLGSVIAYDILTSWSPLVLYDEFITNAIEKQRDAAESEEQRELFANFYESRKKLLEKGGHLQDILLRREEQLSFKVCLAINILTALHFRSNISSALALHWRSLLLCVAIQTRLSRTSRNVNVSSISFIPTIQLPTAWNRSFITITNISGR
jgi:hypothetical protein